VVEVTEHILLKPNRVFVVPPHREITTDGVVLRLAGLTKYHGWPTVISEFLFSLASMCASRGIAIIVSGTGHDGSTALAAVKEAGGSTFAQSDASYPNMPRAAVDTNHVDYLLTARQIGRHLASLPAPSRHPDIDRKLLHASIMALQLYDLIEEQGRALDDSLTLTEDDLHEYKRRNERIRCFLDQFSNPLKRAAQSRNKGR
jgi:two-component system, chemotaxis family, CheB/CheR fusion protein